MAEPKVAMDVCYFDMIETFWDKLLCTGKGPIATDLFHVCAASWSYFTLFGSLVFSSLLGTLISLRHCGRQVHKFFLFGSKKVKHMEKNTILGSFTVAIFGYFLATF